MYADEKNHCLNNVIFFVDNLDKQEGYTMAVMHIGAPACGMNAAVRSFVRNCIYRGDTVCGIHDGIEGLIAGNIKRMDWYVPIVPQSNENNDFN